eukprot:scaffold2498_cov114-Isochrysis_galbana.AAC.7
MEAAFSLQHPLESMHHGLPDDRSLAAARPLIFEMENFPGLLHHPDHIADLVRSFAELGYYSRVEEIRCVE